MLLTKDVKVNRESTIGQLNRKASPQVSPWNLEAEPGAIVDMCSICKDDLPLRDAEHQTRDLISFAETKRPRKAIRPGVEAVAVSGCMWLRGVDSTHR